MKNQFLPWILVLLLVGLIFGYWKCNSKPLPPSIADPKMEAVFTKIDSLKNVIIVERKTSKTKIDSLTAMLISHTATHTIATNKFEKTGTKAVQFAEQVVAFQDGDSMKVIKCDSMASEVLQAKVEYVEMKRVADSVKKDNELLHALNKSHRESSEVKEDTLIKVSESAKPIYAEKKREEKAAVRKAGAKGIWGWAIAAIEFVLLIFKK